MRHLLLLLNLCALFFCNAQNQHMNWHFGSGVGLNFSSGNPVPFSGSMLNTQESCYTVSDAAGNLLFYTNGLDVWDATNTLMPNGSGLLGNISSQCMVIPKPGSSTIYYIIANDATFASPSNGMTYSEVDMTLNSGNGDVTANKNILLNGTTGEWLTAVPHANCIDTWIITHGNEFNSVLFAYHVSAAGINPVPVVTNLGIVVGPSPSGAGIMKPNRAGDQLIMTRPLFDGAIEIIDFDQAAGAATGITNLYTATAGNMAYGVEFSRSGDRLYVGEFVNGEIFQFDMTSINIAATRTLVGNLSVPGEAGQLQIAPNDRIYISYNVFPAGGNFIGAINNPELLGVGCGYVQNAVSFGASTVVNGLPWYYNPNTTLTASLNLGADTSLCAGNELILDTNIPLSLGATYLWSDASTDSILTVSGSGIYWVACQIGSCATIADTVVITVDDSQINFELVDTAGCAPFLLNMSASGSTGVTGWTWNTGDGTLIESQFASHTYLTSGNYTISLTAISTTNCLLQDTSFAYVEVYESPQAEFLWFPPIAEANEPLIITDQSNGSNLAWQWQHNNQIISNDSIFIFTPENDDRFELILSVVDSNGCIDQLLQVIPFHDQDLIFVPNAFTPNGDGTNDVFRALDPYNTIVSIILYNRWGEIVWSTENSQNGWDGNYNGVQATAGIYTWNIKTELDGLSFKSINGHVVLIR